MAFDPHALDPAIELDTDRLAAAKLWLITKGDMPYVATAIYSLITVATREVPTIGADTHWRLYVNPEWLAATDVAVIAVQIAHVSWHLLGDHAQRAFDLQVGPKQGNAWRQATDATIAQLLQRASLDHELAGPADLRLPPDRSAEEYYVTLSRLCLDEDPEKVEESEQAEPSSVDPDAGAPPCDGCGSAADGFARPYEKPARDPVGAVDRHSAEHVRRQVAIEYRDHVKGRGTQPGEWDRWVEQILQPVVPWQQVLAAAVRRAFGWASGRTDYTYSRPSRRQAATPNVILPATRRPLPQVAIVVDTSGSVDDGLLAQAMGEIDGVVTGLGVPGRDLAVLAVDAAVHSIGRVHSAHDVKLAGGGGTDMCIGIDTALGLRPLPDIIIVLTDGGTLWPDQPPERAALIAVIIGRSHAELPPTPTWLQRIECVPR